MRAAALAFLIGAGCCVPAASDKPEDSGIVAARPVLVRAAVGERVWAPFETGRWLFHATIVEASGAEVLVVFEDGDKRSISPAALRPDGVDYGTRVSARWEANGPWGEAIVQRRIGFAVLVRFEEDYEERWISLAWVRVSAERASMMTSPASVEGGRAVLGNWRGEGRWYPGIAVGQRDGRVHVVYADASDEWIAPSAVRESTIARGARVEVRLVPDSSTFRHATVEDVIGSALRLTDDAGTAHWTSLHRVRVP
jgi:hypothetical protein